METKEQMAFRAINPVIESHIPSANETDSKRGFISWGDNNDYPAYLNELYNSVATLHSIIEGTVDFISGNEIKVDDPIWSDTINAKGETIEDIVKSISRDYLKYGGFAINVVRNLSGRIAGLYYIPLERLRSDEKNETFYYSKEWDKSMGRVKFATYPKFNPESLDASSIFFYTNNKTNVYPSPVWCASVKAAEIEKAVNTYHLNGIKNGFAASYFISMNNGRPNEEMVKEIEDNIIEKFSSENNAGRIVLNFADDKEHSAELTKLDTEDVGEKYKALIERTRSEIFTAFRAIPNLFGLPTATGFSSEEYEQAFKLYNRTVVRPIQNVIVKSLGKILNKSITIVPFTMD